MRLVFHEPVSLLGDEQRLLVLVVGAERTASSPSVVSVHNDFGLRCTLCSIRALAMARMFGAVVLLHQEDLGVGVVALEVQEVLDRRAAPRVDALVGVAHHADVPVLVRQQVHQLVLGPVRVLVLVDEDVPEPLLVVLEDRGVIAEQPNGLGDEVVEVQRPAPSLRFSYSTYTFAIVCS